jgi:hypothetical protein
MRDKRSISQRVLTRWPAPHRPTKPHTYVHGRDGTATHMAQQGKEVAQRPSRRLLLAAWVDNRDDKLGIMAGRAARVRQHKAELVISTHPNMPVSPRATLNHSRQVLQGLLLALVKSLGRLPFLTGRSAPSRRGAPQIRLQGKERS